MTFLNNGTPNQTDYKYDPSYQKHFPKLRDWVILRDYNDDGAMDIFTYVKEPADGVGVYDGFFENDSLKFERKRFFEWEFDMIPFSTGPGAFSQIFVSAQDYPAVDDIDGDGDLDILTFASTGGYIYLYNNLSVEMGFGIDSLKYELADDCWGGIFEVGLNTPCVNLPSGPDECSEGEEEAQGFNTSRHPLHSGSTVLTFDSDGDGDSEVILGDLNFSELIFLQNGGSNTNAFIEDQDCEFPSYDVSVDIQTFPASFYLDLNNDGKKDLCAAPNITNGIDFENLWYYPNISENDQITFAFDSKSILVDEMVDLGTGANPTFVDYNKDGLMDLVVGNNSKYVTTSNRPSQLALFLNIGTEESPIFELIEDDWLNFSTFSIKDLTPAFGDLDDDGDEDLIIGTDQGKLFYLENTAGAGNTLEYGLPQFDYMDIDVANNSTPQIIDVDRDGLNDLLIGERTNNFLDPDDPATTGNFNFYKNNGTPTEAFFFADQDTMGNNKVLGFASTVDSEATFGYSAPLMIDFNGTYRLFSGSNVGRIKLFENIDGNLDGTFDQTAFELGGIRQGIITRIAMADIDNDQFYEMLVGNARGGLAFYQTPFNLDGTVPTEDMPADKTQLNLYPNPASQVVNIETNRKGQIDIRVDLYDMQGRLIKTKTSYENKIEIDVATLINGLYLFLIRIGDEVFTEKVIIQ